MHAKINRIAVMVVLLPSLSTMIAGVATAAPTVTGQTYADASSALSNAGLKAVVASTVGDRLSRDKCLVVNQRAESIAQKGTHSTDAKVVALSLNCDNETASAKKPGFSAASPQARAAKAAAATTP